MIFLKRSLCSVLLAAVLAFGPSAMLAGPQNNGPLRRPPTRAALADTVRLGGMEYVPVSELERLFGLKGRWVKRREDLVLKNDAWSLEFSAGSREAHINGMRLLLCEPTRLYKHEIHLSRVDAERVIIPILKPGYRQSLVPDVKVIAIDPGHGGVDNGTQNARLHLMEKNFTLDVSRRLARLLHAQGYKVVLTRDKDEKIELGARALIANTAGADLFISIHFNSLANDRKTNGTEVFTFAPAGVRSTDAWGAKANDAEDEASPGNRYDHWNSVLAFHMQRELLENLKTFDRGRKIAHFAVLRPLKCPGVLVEAGFLSSDVEAKKISTRHYRQEIAEAIAEGVRAYASSVASARSR